MAKHVETVVTLTDDIDGTKADRTVAFTYEGATYEIDLNKKNATAFSKALAPYISAARKTSTRGRRATARKSAPRSTGRRNDLGTIREWARANGHDLSDRGRVPAVVLAAYDAR